jgi:hypothetical protein
VNVINCNTNGTKEIKMNRLIAWRNLKEALMQCAIQDDRTFSSLISKMWVIGYENRTSKIVGDEQEKLN